MCEAERESLARAQAEVVAALIGGAAAPGGFDSSAVALTARTLRNKRARAVAKTWPALAAAVDASFDRLFTQFAQLVPLDPAGALADGGHFAEWLHGQKLLPDEGAVELLFYRARGGWPIRLLRQGRRRRVLLAIRVLGLGIKRIF